KLMEKLTMKSTIKLFLIVALFVSTTFAEGDMGNGGFADDGDMGNGGKTCTTNCLTDNQTDESIEENPNPTESVLTIIQDYLNTIFG
ncbi:MAG TPA: hypothetical protein VGD05_06080, partial [Pyrinomonadaceae bacterium]